VDVQVEKIVRRPKKMTARRSKKKASVRKLKAVGKNKGSCQC
jgi:hypothetical protein